MHIGNINSLSLYDLLYANYISIAKDILNLFLLKIALYSTLSKTTSNVLTLRH